jgi:hypothetical protein
MTPRRGIGTSEKWAARPNPESGISPVCVEKNGLRCWRGFAMKWEELDSAELH